VKDSRPTANLGTLVRDATTGEPLAQVWRETDGWHAALYEGRLPGDPVGPYPSREEALEAVRVQRKR